MGTYPGHYGIVNLEIIVIKIANKIYMYAHLEQTLYHCCVHVDFL